MPTLTSDSDSGANSTLGSASEASAPSRTRAIWRQSAASRPTTRRTDFVVAATLDLPFGRGKAFGSDMNPVLDAIFGGWRLASFVTLQSGQPVAIRMTSNRINGGSQRPNLVGNPCSG